jgi:L-malate glycosyltransferase
MRFVLLGDGESPHLLKWARALAPRVELWVASSRGFAAGFDGVVDPSRRFALNTKPDVAGGNVAVLRTLPRLAAWLRDVRPDWINAHYLTSHGTLAWAAIRWFGVPGRLVASAWGSDILVAPQHSRALRLLTQRVLVASALCTSDSQHMSERMVELGAGEVMTFPFGLDAMPPPPDPQRKDPLLFFSNRALEPVYAPQRVLAVFASVAARWPGAQLAMANDGSLYAALAEQTQALAIASKVRWLGRLDATTQADWYARARWFVSLPQSDSVSVSVLEAMAHGCIPILSDLPANRELVRDGDNGLIVHDGLAIDALEGLALRAGAIAIENRAFIAEHALFPPAIARFVDRLHALDCGK